MAEVSRLGELKFYLPLREEVKVYQRRKVTVEKPLFPGYFFVNLSDEGRLLLLKTNHIVRILAPPSERELLHQLAQIRRALRIDPTLGTCSLIKAGRRVKILNGPFMGIEGVVSDIRGTTKVRLNVEMIGRAVAVEVDRDYLALID